MVTAKSRKLCAPHDRAATLSLLLQDTPLQPHSSPPPVATTPMEKCRQKKSRVLRVQTLQRHISIGVVVTTGEEECGKGGQMLQRNANHTKDAVHQGLGFTVVVGAKLRSLELGSAPGSGPCLGESVGDPSLVIIVLEKCFTLDCSRSRARCKMLEAKMSPPFTSI